MNYTSTRNSSLSVTAADAIARGISADGGLFVPSTDLPKFSLEDIQNLADKSYQERAFEVLKIFLNFSDDELWKSIKQAYYHPNFRTAGVTRLVELDSSAYMLELWHGPTAAFKDMALQILPGLLGASAKKVFQTDRIVILTATSGDTGKAALEAFSGVPGVEIAVFYPENGVSETQRLQMTTQLGENIHVFGVNGNFDDCQKAVKDIFADEKIVKLAEKSGAILASANSINWGRLCPQIAYYVSAYADLVRLKKIKCGDKINICVPTGNFGNILAAYYAMQLGIPVEKLICASNSNNILSDFINTGVYDKNREFCTTISPSMDILVSNNLERLLYHLSGNSDSTVKEWFTSLNKDGKFEVDRKIKTKMKSMFYGGWCSEDETLETIKSLFVKFGYLSDTHTAVGYKVLQDYITETGSKIKTIIASTASPYKFEEAVYEALYGKYEPTIDELIEASGNTTDGVVQAKKPDLANVLFEKTSIPIPKPLLGLNERQVRFTESAEISEIRDLTESLFNLIAHS